MLSLDRRPNAEPQIRSIVDLNSGTEIPVYSPAQFQLQTVLLTSAYYRYEDNEYRFLLCRARELGLKIA